MTRCRSVRIVLGTLALVVCTAPALGGEGLTLFTSTSGCRLVDTRSTDSPVLTVGTLRTFVAPGKCGIPASATALYVNVTAVSPTNMGHLRAYSGSGSPPGTSTVNFAAGSFATGAATIVRLQPNGQFAIYPGGYPGTVHAVLDVLGYYEAAGPLKLHAVAGCRLFDTRMPSEGWLLHGQERSWQVQGKCGVPVGAKAVTATITAVAATSNGHITLYAAGTTAPAIANLNFPTPAESAARANGTLVKLGSGTPDLSVKAFLADMAAGHVDLVFDVTGYYQ